MPEDDASQDERLLDIRAAVAAELRAVRSRLQIKQTDIADRTGLTRVSVNRLLNGSRALSIDQLIRIAGAMGVDPGEILNAAQDRYLEDSRRRDAERESAVNEGLDTAR